MIKNDFLINKFFIKSFPLILVAFNIVIFIERKFLFFRDYSIIWDGAYRLTEGLEPYSDFGIPLGPIVFYIPSIFFKFFGPSWLSLQISQLLINSLLIFIVWGILNFLSSRKIEIILGLLFFNFNYVILLSHPWYNTTAITIFLLSILLTLYRKTYCSFFAGFSCAVVIFTKQDYALMTLISIFAISTFLDKDDNNNIFLNIPKDLNTLIQSFKSKFFISLILGLSLGIIFIVSNYDFKNISYWFNYGQSPHFLRRISLVNIIINPQLYLSIICLWIAIKKKNLSLFVSFLILLTSGFCSQTSGLKFTSGFFYFLIPLILFKFIEFEKSLFKFLSVIFLLIISFFNNFQRSLNTIKAVLKNDVESHTIHYSDINTKVINLGNCAKELSNIYGPQSICKQIDLVRNEISKNNYKHQLIFLNISELSPFYSIFNFVPPKSLPLWFDENVTLFEREKNMIKNKIENNKFDLIALQATHDPWNKFYNEILQNILRNPNYREIGKMQYVSPKGSLKYNYVSKICETSLSKSYSFSEECEESLKPIRFFIKKKI